LPLACIHAGNRTVYLPKGADWVHYFTNKSYTGGQNVTVDAPLDEFPLFTMTSM
jgi:alpha-glucosidase (family GH31 glycosyl hydrolase)